MNKVFIISILVIFVLLTIYLIRKNKKKSSSNTTTSTTSSIVRSNRVGAVSSDPNIYYPLFSKNIGANQPVYTDTSNFYYDPNNNILKVDKIADSTSVTGTTNQVLTSTASGIRWANVQSSSIPYNFNLYFYQSPSNNFRSYTGGTEYIFPFPVPVSSIETYNPLLYSLFINPPSGSEIPKYRLMYAFRAPYNSTSQKFIGSIYLEIQMQFIY